jgi:exopolyphosphatase/guanosine-5'-triphosphate,3'-diphosphate pyrophosphatase
MRLAAIDIGSNAARLKIFDVIVNKQNVAEFNELSFLRLPLRLGFDVFETGKICEIKTGKMLEAMTVYKNLLGFYDVKTYKICATSAMRDAENSKQIVEEVERKTGLKINIISGSEEASLIHEMHIAENMDREYGYLYVDVGGGSTEIIFFVEGEMRYKHSFNIGTIRLLKKMVKDSDWDKMKAEIKTHAKTKLPLVAIGSGGNINKVFSLSEKKSGKPLSLDLLKVYYEDLNSLSVEERMHKYQLRDDRADVIVPALEIYINLMTWANIEKIYVPKIGLADGLAHALYWETINRG